MAQRFSQGEEQLAQRRASWTKPQRAAYVRLSTQFRDRALWLPRGTVARVFAACPLEGAGPACQAPQGAAQKAWTTKRLTVLGIAVGVAALAVAAAVLAFVLLL